MQSADTIQIKQVPGKMDVRAQDGTEIRWLASMNRGSAAHCILQPNQISLAGMHQTIGEIWYCIQGQGEVWLKQGDQERQEAVYPGICFTIPEGVHFQVRNIGSEPLCFIITTMPPWPGEHEWIRVEDHWPTQ